MSAGMLEVPRQKSLIQGNPGVSKSFNAVGRLLTPVLERDDTKTGCRAVQHCLRQFLAAALTHGNGPVPTPNGLTTDGRHHGAGSPYALLNLSNAL